MSDLLTLLKVLYACNLTAEQAPVSQAQALFCVNTLEAVKMQFLTENEVSALQELQPSEQIEVRLRGYRRFKLWEADNPTLVRQIQREQKQKLFPGS